MKAGKPHKGLLIIAIPMKANPIPKMAKRMRAQKSEKQGKSSKAKTKA